jgi:hypothetical protein
MIGLGLLAMFFEDKDVDVSAHLDVATDLSLYAFALVIAMFVIRPELWQRLFMRRVDPRPVAMMRITFGFVVFWTFTDLLKPHGPLEDSVARFLFTDEGLWLTDMARNNYGDKVKVMWDPEHGWQQWTDVFRSMWGKFTILHFRSDPPFAFGVYFAMLGSLLLMIFGVWTRWTTILAWILVEMVYRYSPVFYTGGDTVVRVFMFLGLFARWGEAYSVDSWRRTRKALLVRKANAIPLRRRIPVWPMRLMMLQLCIIYCATGLLKSGSTWADGTALYFALNLDHFYRAPITGVTTFVHWIGVLPAMTVLVHWWEMLFPVAAIGVALNGYERERARGTWPAAALWRRLAGWTLVFAAWACLAYLGGLGAYYFIPPKFSPVPQAQLLPLVTGIIVAIPVVLVALYFAMRRWLPRVHRFVRLWLLGKRFWLVVGFGMHIGIDVGMNVGTFANVMMAVYFAWLSGEELDAFWHYLGTRACAPGEEGRPIRNNKHLRRLLAPIDRLRYRAPGRVWEIRHHPDDDSTRRAALLRTWDVSERLRFRADEDVPRGELRLKVEGEQTELRGAKAGRALIKIFPGLWLMRPLRIIPVVGEWLGALAMKILRQK